jgi:hypothetical protein
MNGSPQGDKPSVEMWLGATPLYRYFISRIERDVSRHQRPITRTAVCEAALQCAVLSAGSIWRVFVEIPLVFTGFRPPQRFTVGADSELGSSGVDSVADISKIHTASVIKVGNIHMAQRHKLRNRTSFSRCCSFRLLLYGTSRPGGYHVRFVFITSRVEVSVSTTVFHDFPQVKVKLSL